VTAAATCLTILTLAAQPATPATKEQAKDPLPAGLTRLPMPPPPPGAVPAAPRDAPLRTPKLLPEDSASVRVRIRKLAYELARSLKPLPGEGRFQTLAVLPFGEEGAEAKSRELGRVVAAELATSMKKDHDLNLVERDRIDAALHEGYLNEMGLVDEKSAVKLGEMLAAQALVVGSVSTAGTEFWVNARIVSTESGQVFAAAQEKLPASGLISYSSEAVVLRTRSGAVFRSMAIPGWGQFYNREETKGWVFLGLAGTLLGSAAGFQLAGMNAHEQYRTTASLALQEEKLGQEQGMYTARNVALGLAAGVWLVNVADAFINGKTFDPARAGD
jgi:TolB-like protein